ncbi:MAG: tRNA pseudouridine(55) synthase TruB [Oscillospiraceae bacterium]
MQQAAQQPQLSGILVVDKPAGFTSFDVVAKMRGICGTRKIGHGGTLDPMATGVLPVFVGAAVKAVDLAPRQDKCYEATVLFGVATDTGDVTGAVVAQQDVAIDEAALKAVLPRFLGKQSQLPPLYSAVKVNGRPLYRYARAGETVQRKPREVEIHALELLGAAGENRFVLRVHCGKGTYVRTLAEDIGAALGAPATLAALRRTAAGVFTLEQAHTLEAIQAAKDARALPEMVRPVGSLFTPLPAHALQPGEAQKLLNGVQLCGQSGAPGLYALYVGGQFAGLGQLDANGVLRGKKMFIGREEAGR